MPLELLSSRGRIEGELDWSKLIKVDRVVLTGDRDPENPRCSVTWC